LFKSLYNSHYSIEKEINNLRSKGAFEMQYKYKKQSGFTIIETMIVLAIAGLIMLIVFLAVPALERSARNTQRKTDAGNILTAIGTYVSNNNGSLPNGQAELNQAICGINLGFYTAPAGCNTVTKSGASKVSATAPTNGLFYSATAPSPCYTISGCPKKGDVTVNNIYFLPGFGCDNNTNQPTSDGSTRSYAVYYEVETGSNSAQAQCIAS